MNRMLVYFKSSEHEPAMWLHAWNGNSPLKVVHGTVQPSTQGGFILHIGTIRGHLVISGRPYNLASVGI